MPAVCFYSLLGKATVTWLKLEIYFKPVETAATSKSLEGQDLIELSEAMACYSYY